MPLSQRFIAELKARCDIENIIGSYIQLKRAGTNSIGICPFHSEKTPSFTIFKNNENFFCFGCGAGGDVITFLMRMENLDYISAIEKLCAISGMSMPDDNDGDEYQKKRVDRKRIYELNKKAALYFYDALCSSKNENALKYITNRGLTPQILKRFGVGYADESFDSLSGYLISEGYSQDELKEAFLAGISKYNKPFDMFRGRIMFPIIDVSGNVIAFGGRMIGDGMPKYLNSSDTPVFNKRRNLYALNFAKNTTDSSLILCEGYMDVIALQQAGFINAVATLGTAITAEQARIMTRYAKKIYICYDSDSAGIKATDKAISLLGEVGLAVKVVTVKGAKDPDEYIKKFGKNSFSNLLNSSSGQIDYKFDKLLENHNMDIPEEKLDFINKSCDMLSEIYSPIELEVFLLKLSEITGIETAVFKREVEKRKKKKEKKYLEKNLDEKIQKTLGYGDRINPDRQKYTAAASIEENILGIIMLRNDYLKDKKIMDNLTPDMFLCEFNREVFKKTIELSSEDDAIFNIGQLGEFFTPEQMGSITKMCVSRSSLSNNSPEVLNELITRLKEQVEKESENDDFEEYLKKLKKSKT